jgi:glutamate synthase (NADPH/NADH) small chain
LAFSQSTLGPSINKQLSATEIRIEANRCLNCYDAPCIQACPTSIDVPRFISRIASGDMLGSARTIMDANPVGASCARVCPVDQLCEGSCVYNADENPIRIGDLQRYSTDWAIATGATLFTAGPATGKRVAVVGSGPAGLAAARELARYGHAVTIFERDPQPGGLDTYGIVPFRLPTEISLWEAEQVAALGVEFRYNVTVGETISADDLKRDYDAVVIAVGMGSVPTLGIEGESAIIDSLEFIRRAKTGEDVGEIGNDVAIIGGGNTAIDAATCSKRLGAENVTMYYRRGQERMTAYGFEIEFAQVEGVEFRTYTLPKRVVIEDGKVVGLEIVSTERDGSAREIVGSERIVPASAVISAIGQTRYKSLFDLFGVMHEHGIAAVDDGMATNVPGVYAAGDCMFRPGGTDAMVVEAAQRGKTAAQSIDLMFAAAAGAHA